VSARELDPIELAKVRRDVAGALGSWWLRSYFGAYLTAAERRRFGALGLARQVELIDYVFQMWRHGFDPVLTREVKRAVLAPGEPDLPVTAKGRPGDPYGPPPDPGRTPAPAAGLTVVAPPEGRWGRRGPPGMGTGRPRGR